MTSKKQLGVPTVEFAPVALSALNLDRHNRQGPTPPRSRCVRIVPSRADATPVGGSTI